MSYGLPKRPEKRHYNRIDMELEVRLEVEGQQVESSTQNISCGGMYLSNIKEGLKEDGSVVAFISLPNNPKLVKLNGRVVRVDKNPDAITHNCAIEFGGLYDENHMQIDHLVKNKILN